MRYKSDFSTRNIVVNIAAENSAESYIMKS